MHNLTDPQGVALVAGARWIEGVLLGSVGTAIAVLAVGWLGVMILTGRLAARRALAVVLGCFFLFGSATVAAGLRALAAEVWTPPFQSQVRENFDPDWKPAPLTPAVADPYAGASVPVQR